MTIDWMMKRRTLVGALAVGVATPNLAFGQSLQGSANMKVEFAFSNHVFTATLHDNASARDFASMMPLDLTIDDYSNNEKVAYLPRKLTEEGSGPFTNE